MRDDEQTKVMTAKKAVEKFVPDGALVGLGGQNVARCPMAIVHEIVRQGKRDLTVCGCNQSIPLDILVGAGLVRRVEAGTGNLERFGTIFNWRRAIEQGLIEMEDYSHLAMVTRFLAGEMGVPFMPTKSMLGSDMLKCQAISTKTKFVIVDNPWNPGEQVVLVPALCPDVAIIHVQKADSMGNVVIEGFLAHEPEMVKAAKHTIVCCEKIISTDTIRENGERTTIPYLHVSAVVEQAFGAYPTATHNCYDYDADHVTYYQKCAREGGEKYHDYLKKYILDCDNFGDYIELVGGEKKMAAMKKAMQKMMQ
jgi:acyl CoA:acetate/3-ketoacid CoA transferase alpha subunit